MRNSSLDDNVGLLNDSTPIAFSGVIGQLYRKQEVYDINIPTIFMNRLPFHIFLNEDESFFKNTLMPIIFNEITIYNISVMLIFNLVINFSAMVESIVGHEEYFKT